jgi:putative oxidoreductase
VSEDTKMATSTRTSYEPTPSERIVSYEPPSDGATDASHVAVDVAALLGRTLLSAIFLISGVHKLMAWHETAAQMENEGMVAVPFFLGAAVVLELAGGLSVLMGFHARLGATALIVFLIPTTVIYHDFWTFQGEQQQMQLIHFMKNLAIIGGLAILAAFGPGRLAVTSIQEKLDAPCKPHEDRELTHG